MQIDSERNPYLSEIAHALVHELTEISGAKWSYEDDDTLTYGYLVRNEDDMRIRIYPGWSSNRPCFELRPVLFDRNGFERSLYDAGVAREVVSQLIRYVLFRSDTADFLVRVVDLVRDYEPLWHDLTSDSQLPFGASPAPVRKLRLHVGNVSLPVEVSDNRIVSLGGKAIGVERMAALLAGLQHAETLAPQKGDV